MLEQNQVTLHDKPGCLAGCVMAFVGSIAGAIGLSLMSFATQAMFNPKPLQHEFWPALSAFITGCVGAAVGFVAAFIYWQFRPKARLLIVALLVVAVAFCFLTFEPGDPSDMNDPHFMVD